MHGFGVGEFIYGAAGGYPGGIAWTILVAKLCMDNPKEASIWVLLEKFFNLFGSW